MKMKAEKMIKAVPSLVSGFANARILSQGLKEKPQFSLVVIADAHTDGDFYRDRTNILRRALGGISRYNRSLDVLALCGDNTNCGDETEYANLRRLFDGFVTAKHIIPAIGNHDSWHQSINPDFSIAKRLFLELCHDCGYGTDRTYYSAFLCGRRFICLGTQDYDMNDTKIYDDQIEWFRNEMKAAANDEHEVIVLFHQPIGGRNGIDFPETKTAFSAAFDEIMCEAAPALKKGAFFFTGHVHALTGRSIEQVNDKLCYINLPSFEYGHRDSHPGPGCVFNVYEDRTEIEIYNFIENRCYLRQIITED